MADSRNEPFIRWQGRSLEYFSYSINLLLAFSVGTLGFGVNLLRDASFSPSDCAKYLFAISLLSQILSVAIGLACVLYRVKDFRDTTTIAKKKSQLEFDSELETLRGLVGIIGSRTRRLFGWQVSFFSVGTILLVGILVYEYSEKLV
jgi:uncharacterized membrane protein YgdD (TMEM256/DUF423 family)